MQKISLSGSPGHALTKTLDRTTSIASSDDDIKVRTIANAPPSDGIPVVEIPVSHIPIPRHWQGRVVNQDEIDEFNARYTGCLIKPVYQMQCARGRS